MPRHRGPGVRGLIQGITILTVLVAFANGTTRSARIRKPGRAPKVKSKTAEMARVRKTQAQVARTWYSGLKEKLTDFPVSGIKERTIVIDPGHTNSSPGAEGPNRRVTEADVNWGVATHLARLLTSAGARAVLTVPYGKPKPVSERNAPEDLDRRAAIAERERADLFLSIHHNWRPEMSKNRTEVYYRLDDPGPSRDAAGYIVAHLTRNLGLEGSIYPANYRVLRVNTRPAILTEASHISNPIQESLLALPEKQQLEATAIYLGILDYFSRGVPEFRIASDLGSIVNLALPRIDVQTRDQVGLDPTTIRTFFDSIPGQVAPSSTVPARVGPGTKSSSSRPQTADQRYELWAVTPSRPLGNGPHRFRFEARNKNGNAGIVLDTSLVTDRAPAALRLLVHPPVCPPGLFEAEVRAIVVDDAGQPVAAARKISFTVDQKPMGDSLPRAGSSRIYVRQTRPGSVTVTARCGELAGSTILRFATTREPLVQFRIRSSDTTMKLQGATVLDDWRTDTTMANEDGLVTLSPAPGSHTFTFSAPGYRPSQFDLKAKEWSPIRRDVYLQPLLAGTLHGLCVALDPAGRYEKLGNQTVGRSKSGVEAPPTTRLPRADAGGRHAASRADSLAARADFNLALVRRLTRLLGLAGASVLPLRLDTVCVTRAARMERTSAARAALYLRFEATGDGRAIRVSHYPGSVAGEKIARSIARRLKTIPGVRQIELRTTQAYEITNAGCPAVNVEFASAPGSASTTPDSTLLTALARELLLAIAHARSDSLVGKLTLAITHGTGTQAGQPVTNARVVLDDLLSYQCDSRGRLVVSGLDLGTHRITVSAPTAATSTHEFTLTPRAPSKTLVVRTTPKRR